MKFKNEKKIDINILLEKLKSITNINEKGEITYNAFEIEDIKWIFLSLIEFKNNLNFESKKQILSKTFRDLALNNRFEKEYFLKSLIRNFQDHNKKENNTFFLLTSISVTGLSIRTINFKNCIIRIHGKNFPKKFLKNRNNLLKKKKFDYDINDHTKISIQVDSKTSKDAYSKAFFHLEVVRGLLCLLVNHGREIRMGGRDLKPINRVLKGETLTLHSFDGKIINDDFYYFCPEYKPQKTLILENSKKISNSLKQLIKSFNNCKPKHQFIIGETLNCYVDGFDESSSEIAFLKAWTALEKITNTNQNDILIKRSTALLKKEIKPYNTILLEALRTFRNEFVHEGMPGPSSFQACYFIQPFLFSLIIRFNLSYSGFFENIEEANHFLDHFTPEISELKKRKKILDKILKMKLKYQNE